MSSWTKSDPKAASKIVAATESQSTAARIARLGMSPRQQRLNHLYSIYRCQQYEHYKCDWDGSERQDSIGAVQIATAGFVPPGFYDAGANLPIKFRKPSAPFQLCKTIVDRFTGLLFDARHHPEVVVTGDEDTDQFVQGLCKGTRIWSKFIEARKYGGSMGAVCISFQFHKGKPMLEVHDPRWIRPEFEDIATFKLSGFEIRYQYPEEEFNHEKGIWEEVPYWYRRAIDSTRDVVYNPEPVGDGEEPTWSIKTEVVHGLGFCPAVWIQNTPESEDTDGDPDCHGAYDQLDAIDRLLAEANKGILRNADPTVVISTDGKLDDVKKGSENAIKLQVNGSASYMEMNGAGAKAALELADRFRSQVLEVTQCVIDHPDLMQRTATEVNKGYAAMEAKADVLREQYGEHGIKPLIEMMLLAAQRLSKKEAVEGVGVVSKAIILPPRVEEGKIVPHKLGSLDVLIELHWPPYMQTSTAEIVQAVTAATTARTANIIDQKTATQFIAPHFQIEDVMEVVEAIEAEKASAQADLEASAMSAMDPREKKKPATEE